MDETRRLRMFPLGTVLFPRGVLPLHVFEPRYLTLVSHAMESDGRLGIVLIERGSEVGGGGGDERFPVGCAARIVRAGRVGESRLAIVAVGLERIRIESWLPDDPYPVALVSGVADGEPDADLSAAVHDAHRRFRRVMAMASELGADVGTADLELPDDPREAVWGLCAAAPIEQLDRQKLLEIDHPTERLAALTAALDDKIDVLDARLSGS